MVLAWILDILCVRLKPLDQFKKLQLTFGQGLELEIEIPNFDEFDFIILVILW